MNTKQWLNNPVFRCFAMLLLFVIATSQPAFADFMSGMDDLKSKVATISTPLAVIFLIVAGWQKAIGNNQLFFGALTGTVIMFGAPQIVEVISASFGR